MDSKHFYGKGRALFFLFVPVVLALAGYAVMWLWNAILPDLLGLKAISFWQAVGLFLLCKILFGNFYGPAKRRGVHSLRERLKAASPEEREALKEEWRNRCRGGRRD